MAPQKWATIEQGIFLNSLLDDYRKVQAKGQYDKFWPVLYEEWFKIFDLKQTEGQDPNVLAAAIKTRQGVSAVFKVVDQLLYSHLNTAAAKLVLLRS